MGWGSVGSINLTLLASPYEAPRPRSGDASLWPSPGPRAGDTLDFALSHDANLRREKSSRSGLGTWVSFIGTESADPSDRDSASACSNRGREVRSHQAE